NAANLGEWHEPETHLIPNALRAAAGTGNPLTLFGDDYPTPDGTCIRDYLHVMDLAEAHVAALAWCFRQEADESVVRAFNLGTGQGASVLEVIQAFERATGERVPYRMGERRAGDVVAIWADPSRAKEELGWATRRSLETSLADSWKWQQALKKG
ncbi:MAG: GDP-mannose 4,6-dehydratase, partial [Flavobacteriales bacterium]